MSIPVVKNAMLQAFKSIGSLEASLNSLSSSVSSITIANYKGTGSKAKNTATENKKTQDSLNKMHSMTAAELDVFFSEFNNDTKQIIKVLEKLQQEVQRISGIIEHIQSIQHMQINVAYFRMRFELNTQAFRMIGNGLNKVKNDLMLYK